MLFKQPVYRTIIVCFQSTYDQELHALQETIQDIVVALLNDADNSVKRAIMDNNGITRLCVFFGRQKGDLSIFFKTTRVLILMV